MFFGPLLFILLIFWVMFMIINPNHHYRNGGCHSGHTMNTNMHGNRPLDILKERYAKGEISEEEYLKAKRNLE